MDVVADRRLMKLREHALLLHYIQRTPLYCRYRDMVLTIGDFSDSHIVRDIAEHVTVADRYRASDSWVAVLCSYDVVKGQGDPPTSNLNRCLQTSSITIRQCE